MKKILTHLTGIAFVIAILLASGCNFGQQANSTDPSNAADNQESNGPVKIYLRAVLIDGEVHLEMYDSKKPEAKAVDGLLTELEPGEVVRWKKYPSDASIHKIDSIRLRTNDKKLLESLEKVGNGSGQWILTVPDGVEPGIIKYDIYFRRHEGGDVISIDPYLKFP